MKKLAALVVIAAFTSAPGYAAPKLPAQEVPGIAALGRLELALKSFLFSLRPEHKRPKPKDCGAGVDPTGNCKP